MIACGVRIDDKEMIQEYARLYLYQQPKDDVVKYYLFYAQKDPNRYDLVLDCSKDSIREVILHMIRHTDIKKLLCLRRFIAKQSIDQMPYLQIVDSLFGDQSYDSEKRKQDEDVFSTLSIPIEFPEEIVRPMYKRNAILVGIIGLVLLMVAYFAGVSCFADEVRYFYTVFISIIPAYLLALALSFVIFKKSQILFILVSGLLILILLTYVMLLPESASFLTHCLRVLKSGYEFIVYIEEGFII